MQEQKGRIGLRTIQQYEKKNDFKKIKKQNDSVNLSYDNIYKEKKYNINFFLNILYSLNIKK